MSTLSFSLSLATLLLLLSLSLPLSLATTLPERFDDCSAPYFQAGICNYYAILGVEDSEFDANALKSAYRALAVKWHPDKYKAGEEKEEAEERFREIVRAYEILGDEKKRAEYDEVVEALKNPYHYDPNLRDHIRFRPSKPPKDLNHWPILVILLIIATGLQYMYRWMYYWRLQRMASRSTAFRTAKNRHQSGGGKKKGRERDKREEEESLAYQHIQIRGYHPNERLYDLLPAWLLTILPRAGFWYCKYFVWIMLNHMVNQRESVWAKRWMIKWYARPEIRQQLLEKLEEEEAEKAKEE